MIIMIIDLFIFMVFLNVSASYENIAYLKPTWQATTHYGMVGLGSDKAVDGLKSNLPWFGHQCSISSNSKTSATWWVDLQGILSIHHIVIYYRTDNFPWDDDNPYKRRFLGFSVYVSNTRYKENGTLCFHDNEYNISTIPAVVNISCIVHGRYVIYYNERLPSREYPQNYSETAYNELCEVEVYGCPVGYYGSDCLLPCLRNCRQCDVETGECIQCMAGFQGENCKLPCDHGWFGDDCKRQCGECIGECNPVNGNCTEGCKAGYRGARCNQTCYYGKYGLDCAQDCGACYFCHHVTGSCSSGCFSGYEGDKCNQKCDEMSYGRNCVYQCGNCNSSCHHRSGFCLDGCKPGYLEFYCDRKCNDKTYGSYCSKRCGHCIGKCNHIDGSCIGGCETGYKGKRCHEVCNFGAFGRNCQQKCSIFCFNTGSCNRTSGKCLNGCKKGWQGDKCLAAAEKDYGDRFTWTLVSVLLYVSIVINAAVAVSFTMKRFYMIVKSKQANEETGRVSASTTSMQTLPMNMDVERIRGINVSQFGHLTNDNEEGDYDIVL